MLEAWKAQRKQQIVYEINKVAASMHTLIFADGALGPKNARDCSQKQYFEEGTERKNGDRNGEESEKSKLNDKKCFYGGRLEVKKQNFWLTSLEGVLQKWCPRSSRNNNFENMWCKKCVEAWKA